VGFLWLRKGEYFILLGENDILLGFIALDFRIPFCRIETAGLCWVK